MLTINGNILGKDFNDEILVDGINVWNQDAMQFSLYHLVDASADTKDELGIKESYEIRENPDQIKDYGLNMYSDPFYREMVDPSLEKVPISNATDLLLVFPFQCGIKYAPGYHLLNIRDCIGVTTLEELQKLWKGEL